MATFDERDLRAWAVRFAGLIDPAGPLGHHDLDGGRFPFGAPWMPAGIYVGVRDRELRYVGMVCRDDAGIGRRLAEHRQPVATWTGVWLLPLRASEAAVRICEQRMIRALQPPDNVQHVGRRRGVA